VRSMGENDAAAVDVLPVNQQLMRLLRAHGNDVERGSEHPRAAFARHEHCLVEDVLHLTCSIPETVIKNSEVLE